MQELPKLHTLPEVARALGVSAHTIRSFVRQGKLRPLRICRRVLFDSEEVARFVRDAKSPLQSIATVCSETKEAG
jgi:excisionase family DNA binding protein